MLLLAIGTLRAVTLPAFPLLDPTESRYANIPMVMLTTGNWVVPQMKPGVPFWGKPPLSFWLTAASIKAFGHNEIASRLPSFLACVFTVWLTVLLAARLRVHNSQVAPRDGADFAYFCGAILGSGLLFFISSGYVQTDSVLMATTTLSFVSLPLAAMSSNRLRASVWGHLFFVGLGLALLAKGPIALVTTVLAVGGWMVLKRQWKLVSRLPWLTGTILMLAISVPWYVAAEIRSPGFLNYFLLGEHVYRFLVPGWRSLYGTSHRLPPGTIWAFSLLSGTPWILLMLHPRCWRKSFLYSIWSNPWLVYFLGWILAPLLFFTPARNVMITYVMSGLPAMAMLIGWLVYPSPSADEASNSRLSSSRLTLAMLATLAVPIGYFFTAFLIMPHTAQADPQKDVFRVFTECDQDHDGELLYFGEMPGSAYFYSGGAAKGTEDKSTETMARGLRDGGQKYFVMRHTDEMKFLFRVTQKTEEVATVGKYVIRRTPDGRDPMPAASTYR